MCSKMEQERKHHHVKLMWETNLNFALTNLNFALIFYFSRWVWNSGLGQVTLNPETCQLNSCLNSAPFLFRFDATS